MYRYRGKDWEIDKLTFQQSGWLDFFLYRLAKPVSILVIIINCSKLYVPVVPSDAITW